MKNIINTGILSACLAVMYISAIFLIEVVSYKFELPATFMYMGLMAVLYFISLISRDRKSTIIKWLLSIPLAIPVWFCFVKSDYSLRALNWAIPEYGSQSGGGAFAVVFLWAVFSAVCFIALLVSIAVKPKLPEKVWRIQPFVSIIVTLMLIAAVLFLERQFPSAEDVAALIYS